MVLPTKEGTLTNRFQWGLKLKKLGTVPQITTIRATVLMIGYSSLRNSPSLAILLSSPEIITILTKLTTKNSKTTKLN
jgi:hypothetical protein